MRAVLGGYGTGAVQLLVSFRFHKHCKHRKSRDMHILCSFRRLYTSDGNDLGKESEEKGFSFELLLIFMAYDIHIGVDLALNALEPFLTCAS